MSLHQLRRCTEKITAENTAYLAEFEQKYRAKQIENWKHYSSRLNQPKEPSNEPD